MQQICDRLGPDQINALLDKWLAILPNPFTDADRAAGCTYEVSVLQAEFSLAQMFGKPVSGRLFRQTESCRADLMTVSGQFSCSPPRGLAFWMATGVFALTVWMLVVPDSRWGNQGTRVLMAFAMALCPASPETFGVLLYSFWWATLWPVIILGWKRDMWWAPRGALFS